MRPAQRQSEVYLFKSIPNCVNGGCHARVWIPDKRPSGALRVSVAYHGGGWTFGDSIDVPDPDVEYLVSRGVVVVGLQYRLAPHASFEEILEDALDGYAWVWTQLTSACGLEGKVEQAYVHGWSAGGHITAMVGKYHAQRNVPKPSGLMIVYGVVDIALLYRGDGHQSAEMQELQSQLEAGPVQVGIPLNAMKGDAGIWYNEATKTRFLGRLLGRSPSRPAQFNPIEFIDSDFPPTCLLCASEDALIPPAQWSAFARRLDELRVPYKEIWAEGMNHGQGENCDDPKSYEVWLRDCIQPGIRWTLGER